jgi:hypothetical protein
MSKGRKHFDLKTNPPVTRLAEYTIDVNGVFTLVTDITDDKVFDKAYREWFDSPLTKMWCGESLAEYIQQKFPKNFCLLKEDYLKKIKDINVIPATKEEWESENN